MWWTVREQAMRRVGAIGFGLALATQCAAAEPAPAPTPARADALVRMVRQDCGSCHGMRLTGGLGPPLTPQAIAGKPDDALVATILYGRRGTPMPPWRDFVSQDDADWIVEQLRKGFPDAR